MAQVQATIRAPADAITADYINEYDRENFTVLCNTSEDALLAATDHFTTGSVVNVVKAEVVFLLIFYVLILVGNLSVLLWRCSRKGEQRSSTSSILVINLAAADFLIGIQMILGILISSSLLCIAWVSIQNQLLMKSLCIASGILEITGIAVSGMLTGTIAFYYATTVFGRCCCGRRCSRSCIVGCVCFEWIIALSAAVVGSQFLVSYRDYYPDPEVYVFISKTHQVIDMNSTFSPANAQICFPVTNTLIVAMENAFTFPLSFLAIPFVFTYVFVLSAAVIYLAIGIKMKRLRAASLRLSSNRSNPASVNLGGLGFRLAAIAILTVLCWTGYAILIFLNVYRQLNIDLNRSGVMLLTLPFAIMAFSNPVTFTLASKPFLTTIKSLKRALLFKCSKPTPLEDVTINSDVLIPTRLPEDDSENERSLN